VSPNEGYAIRLPDEELRQLIETRRERDILKRPVSAKPDGNKSGDNKPDENKPDGNKPDDEKPADKKQEDKRQDDKKSDASPSEAPKPDAKKPDAAQPAGKGEPEGAPDEAALKGDRQLTKAFEYLLGKLSDKPADAKP
jgi:hypothetical protein